MKIFEYDSFTKVPGLGNPAGIVNLHNEKLSEDQMQQIALASDFNETVFISRSSEGQFSFRFFTPGHEINLCGHATVAGVGFLFDNDMIEFYPEVHVRKTLRGPNAHYYLPWTPIKRADRHEIALQVPSLAGIYEILYQNEKKSFVLLTLDQAWYGGVQGKIRESIDEDLEKDVSKKKILSLRPIYYRYVLTDSWEDIQDILFMLIQKYKGLVKGLESSGRYKKLFLNQDGL